MYNWFDNALTVYICNRTNLRSQIYRDRDFLYLYRQTYLIYVLKDYLDKILSLILN